MHTLEAGTEQNEVLDAQPEKKPQTKEKVLEVANQAHTNTVMAANHMQSKAVGGADGTLEDLFTHNAAFAQEKNSQVAKGSDITLKLNGREFTAADYQTVRKEAEKLNQHGAMLHLFELTTEAEQTIRAMKIPNVTAHSMQHSHDAFVAEDETPAEPVATEKKTELAA